MTIHEIFVSQRSITLFHNNISFKRIKAFSEELTPIYFVLFYYIAIQRRGQIYKVAIHVL